MRIHEFVNIIKSMLKHPSVYAFGQIGSPISDTIIMEKTPYPTMTAAKKNQTTREYAKSYAKARPTASTVPEGTFGFDCSGMIQAALCNWQADTGNYLGGDDLSLADQRYTADYLAHSTGWVKGTLSEEEWSSIRPGDVMWQSSNGSNANHIAVYIGNNEAIECAYDWCGNGYNMTDGVQLISLCGYAGGYMRTNRNNSTGMRRWIAFGSLPMLEYDPVESFEKGDKVKLKEGVTTNYLGVPLSSWVYDGSNDLYVYSSDDTYTKITVDKTLSAVTATVWTKDVTHVVDPDPIPEPTPDVDPEEDPIVEIRKSDIENLIKFLQNLLNK